MPHGTTDADLTPDFITNGINNMIPFVGPDMPDMPNIGTDIRDILDDLAGESSGDTDVC